MGSVPAAMAGGLVLGLGETYGVALFGSSARNLVAFAFLLAALFLRPGGLFGPRASQAAGSPRRELPAQVQDDQDSSRAGPAALSRRAGPAAGHALGLRPPDIDGRVDLRAVRAQPQSRLRDRRHHVAGTGRAHGARGIRLGTPHLEGGLAFRGLLSRRRPGRRPRRQPSRLPRPQAQGLLYFHSYTRHRRDRQPDHPELGLADAGRPGHRRHSRAEALRQARSPPSGPSTT